MKRSCVLSIFKLLSTPLAGYFSSGKATNQGYSGSLWSSTWKSSTYMYALFSRSTSVTPSDFNNRGRSDGNSVRCVFGS